MDDAAREAAHPDRFAPVEGQGRHDELDALRGFALFGILVVNIEWFAQPVDHAGKLGAAIGLLDGASMWLAWTLAQNKFWVLFSLLFGIGFALQTERPGSGWRRWAAPYSRRILVLFALGVLHAWLGWPGDILVPYALASIWLLLLRGLPPCAQLFYGVVLWTIFAAIEAVPAAVTLFAPDQAPDPEVRSRLDAASLAESVVFAQGSWLQVTRLRWRMLMDHFDTIALMLFGIGAAFLVGRWLWNSGCLAPGAEARLRWIVVSGVGVGLPVTLAAALLAAAGTSPDDPSTLAGNALLFAGALPLALAYMGGFLLLWRGTPLRRWMRPLAPAGRLALTNYLLQTAVCSTLFFGYGLGWKGEVGRAAQLLLAVAIFALQLILSGWWSARFRFGPLEWAWRSLTYLRPMPMRRAWPDR